MSLIDGIISAVILAIPILGYAVYSAITDSNNKGKKSPTGYSGGTLEDGTETDPNKKIQR